MNTDYLRKQAGVVSLVIEEDVAFALSHALLDAAEEIDMLRDALKSANGICRSTHSIAEREGDHTNWIAFKKRLNESLLKQHKIMYKEEKICRGCGSEIEEECEAGIMPFDHCVKDDTIEEKAVAVPLKQIRHGVFAGNIDVTTPSGEEFFIDPDRVAVMNDLIRRKNNKVQRRLDVIKRMSREYKSFLRTYEKGGDWEIHKFMAAIESKVIEIEKLRCEEIPKQKQTNRKE